MKQGSKKSVKEWIIALAIVTGGAMLMMLPEVALAQSSTGLPWEGPLCLIAKSLSGPVAKTAAVILIVATGLMVGFGEISGMFGTAMKILFGLSLALGVTQWVGPMFGAGVTLACVGS